MDKDEKKQYPQFVSKALKDLENKGFDIVLYAKAVREESEDLITLRHPLNYLSEEENEVHGRYLLEQVTTAVHWINLTMDSVLMKIHEALDTIPTEDTNKIKGDTNE